MSHSTSFIQEQCRYALNSFEEFFDLQSEESRQALVYPEEYSHLASFSRYIQRTLAPICQQCGDQEAICFCGGGFLDPTYDHSQQLAAPARSSSNDFESISQEMESSSSGPSATAAPATQFTNNSNNHTGAMTIQIPANEEGTASQPQDITSPTRPPHDLHQLDYHLPLHDVLLDTKDLVTDDQIIPLPDAVASEMALQGLDQVNEDGLAANTYANGDVDNDADMDADLDRENQRAFAKIVFPDGDFLVTHTTIVLGRNQERHHQILRSQKQGKRAREALDTYRKEPSQSSQPGDGDQHAAPSESSQSLEGRPAPPSNFSEQGGPVWYKMENETEWRLSKPRHRISHRSKSSSTTSVAPASLHAGVNPDASEDEAGPIRRSIAFVPIHTEIPEHINKISRQHLVIRYNFDREFWELEVVGNRAFVNEILFEKGTVVPLVHNDEIIIASLRMVFKLPDNVRQSPGLSRGTFSESGHVDASDEESSDSARDRGPSTSPPRRLLNAVQSGDSESEDGEDDKDDEVGEASASKSKRPLLKLKARAGINTGANGIKLEQKGKAQKSLKNESSSDEPPTATNKKAGKKPEKKPKTGGKTIPGTAGEASREATLPAKTATEETAPLNEPPRRKGPGRPPKEGTVSKRDKSLAQKLMREYTQRGEQPPDYTEAVEIVRQQQKDKAIAAKMGQNGQAEPGQDVRPSIEVDSNGAGPSTLGKDGAANGEGSTAAKRASPKAKRPIRALSPVKPKAECTEEELRKPDCTYLQLIDGILSEHPTGIADLQDIYERCMKKYPYFKYVIEGVGWQSSVRHNLLQNARFTAAGKSGKGKLWTIDHDVPIEKAPKRKKSPPRKDPMTNGHYHPGHAQHPQYGPGYGQPQPNGQPPMGPGGYYSPYPQAGYPPYQQGGQPPHGHPQWQAQAPAPQVPQTPWDRLIADIIKFNMEHARHFESNPDEQARQNTILGDFLNFLSDCYDAKVPPQATTARVRASQNQGAFGAMAAIFRKHKPEIFIPDPWDETVAVEEQFRLSRASAEQTQMQQVLQAQHGQAQHGSEQQAQTQHARGSPSQGSLVDSATSIANQPEISGRIPAPRDAADDNATQPALSAVNEVVTQPAAIPSPSGAHSPTAGGSIGEASTTMGTRSGYKRSAEDGAHDEQPEAKRTRND